ncbi:MAG: protein jag [Clostridia bacterium]|nr:protein jag [Clostridia bacterium]
MRTIESSGKTVEEALSAGLKQLGVDISAVTHEVLDKGSPGLFGMFGRLAKVRITVTEEPAVEDDIDFDIAMPTLSIAPELKTGKGKEKTEKKKDKKSEKTEDSKKESPKPAKEAVKAEPKESPKAEAQTVSEPVSENEEKSVSEKSARPRRERKPREKKPKATAENIVEDKAAEQIETAIASQPAREFPPLDVDSLSEDAKKAYEFILGITRLMQVDVEIRMLEEEKQIFVDISGDTLGVLIGRRGDTLDAIQYLTSLTVNKDKDEYIRVTIDVEHYRAKREETLRKLAVRMANRARKSGRRVVLEPMNPYERRVLHSALQDNPYVQTHSEGEEPYRRVIITLK